MKNFFSSKTLPFWLFTISAILILTVSQLVQDGVFMDGMLYISVSKNLADGMGTFWEPHFSKTTMEIFREQPPLYFGILAIFYKIFGDSMYVERLFCFICFALTLYFIHKIWKSIFHNENEIKKHSWLPILFFSTIPVCFWAYANHVEETVMTLFATMSIYYSCKALFEKEKIIFNFLLAGICVFLSSLTKGIQGMFPITAVFFFWLIKKDFTFKQNVIYSTILVFIPFLIYGLLILSNFHIYEVLKNYIENRLGNSFNSEDRSTASYRFEILVRLFFELIPTLGIMLITFILHRKIIGTTTLHSEVKNKAIWLFLIGISGSLPLMITMEQRGFYLLTSLPFFSISFASLIAYPVKDLINKINYQKKASITFRWMALVIFIASTTYTVFSFGNTKRDKKMLSDIYTFGKIIPRGEIVGIPIEMAATWNFQTYMIRYNYISSDVSGKANRFFIIEKELSKNLIPSNYKIYPLKTEYLDLYINKDKN